MSKRLEEDYNPVDYYNHHNADEAIDLMLSANKTATKDGKRIYETLSNGSTVEIHLKDGCLEVEDDCSFLHTGVKYTPFMLLTKFQFKGNYEHAYSFLYHKRYKGEMLYMRIGVDYFKRSTKTDRYGIERPSLERWNKQEITQDNGKWLLSKLPKYDGFTLAPSNINYQQTVNGHFNLYHPFTHVPVKDSWKWTERLLRHVFGSDDKLCQLGLKYI